VIVSPNATKVPQLTWCTGSGMMRSLVGRGATRRRRGVSATRVPHASPRKHDSREGGMREGGMRELDAVNRPRRNPRHANQLHANGVRANRGGSAGTGPVRQAPQIRAKSATRRYGDGFAWRTWLRLVA
jgi:hypothetical protein